MSRSEKKQKRADGAQKTVDLETLSAQQIALRSANMGIFETCQLRADDG